MSGLFATLAAAARGEASALTPRSQALFEPDDRDGQDWLFDVRNEVDGEIDAASRADARAPARQQRGRDAADGAAPGGGSVPMAAPTLLAATGTDSAAIAGQSSAATQDVSKLNNAKAMPYAPYAGEPLLPPRVPESADNATTDTEPRLTPASGPDGDPAPRHRPTADPSIQPQPASATDASGAPATLVGPMALPREQRRGFGERSLSIGRIEVRPPPPAPTTPSPAAPAYRAPTIARALPRQSLDDYRRRGR
jgi:hypothetical protein